MVLRTGLAALVGALAMASGAPKRATAGKKPPREKATSKTPRTVVRLVVEQPPARPTQFCIGELAFFDAAGRDIPASDARASHPRTGPDFPPRYLVDGRLHHDFCSDEPIGWVSVSLAADADEIAGYKIGSDCGEDTPTRWRLEYRREVISAVAGGLWDTLDARSGVEWAPGCGGEWRSFSAQRWRVLRITATVENWCASAVEVFTTNNKRVPLTSVAVVAGTGSIEGGPEAFAALLKRSRGLMSRDPDSEWCSARDSRPFADGDAAAAYCAGGRRRGSACAKAAPLGTFESVSQCAAAAAANPRCARYRTLSYDFDGSCGCCRTSAVKADAASELFEYGPCVALVVALDAPKRADVGEVRLLTSGACAAPPPKVVSVEGCLVDRDPKTGERLPPGECLKWHPVARDADLATVISKTGARVRRAPAAVAGYPKIKVRPSPRFPAARSRGRP